MKKLFLILLFAGFYASIQAQYTSATTEGVLPWELESSWDDNLKPDPENIQGTVQISSYIDRTGSLSLSKNGTKITVGNDDDIDYSDLSAYDILVVRGDLTVEKNKGDLIVKRNGIVFVFGDIIFDKNKGTITNEGILVVTGTILFDKPNNNGDYEDDILRDPNPENLPENGLLFLNGIDQSDGTFLFPPTIVNNSDAANAAFDIGGELCDPLFLPGDARRPILGSVCDFVSSEGETPLPIVLGTFEAIQSGNTVELQWNTLAEINNDYFTVERSYNGQDFESIGIVAGNGDTHEVKEYTFSDSNPLPGTVYYRLKQTDFDGASETFNPIVVNMTVSETSMVVYPNPMNDELVNLRLVGLEKEKAALINVSDLQGRSLYNSTISVDREGAAMIEMDIASKLVKGTYIVSIVQEGLRFNEKLVKM